MELAKMVESLVKSILYGVAVGCILVLTATASSVALLYQKATLVEEIRVDRAYLQFLYQVCRDQRYDTNEDRSECYGVVLEQEKKKAVNIKALEN